MSIVQYGKNTPWSSTPQSNNALGFYVHRPIPADGTDILYSVEQKYQYRPDRLAYTLYSDPNLYWVFMVRNTNVMVDPIWDLTAGLLIYVPTKTRLLNVLGLA